MRRLVPSSVSIACSALLAIAGGPARASDGPDGQPALCPPPLQPPERIRDLWEALDRADGLLPPPAVTEPADLAPSTIDSPATAEPGSNPSAPVRAEASRVSLVSEGVSQLEGDVWLQQGENFLSSDAIEFDETTGVVRTLAPARFGSRQMIVDAENIVYDTRIGEGVFDNIAFYMPRRGGRGEADSLERTGASTAYLDGVKYTTCPPDDEDWWLKASSLDLDQEEGMGVGRNVRIGFMGVPFFYTPWISFPIDERRKTGFLFPEFGDSGRHGAWLRTPYYLNLAPNYDATLVPYYMERRGMAVEGEFRYLFGWGSGRLEAMHLDEDRQTGTERYNYQFQHASRLPADWVASVRYQQVSDEAYFQDFSQDGRGLLRSHIAQVATLRKSELEYGASIRFQRFQTVDPTLPESSAPYEKWPELDFYYAPLAFGDVLWFDLEGESVYFQREGRVSGWRHHTETGFSMDFGDPGLRLTPRLAWWQTQYDLEQPDGNRLDLDRGLPIASLDLRARFVRALAEGEQTLEPRLYLLHIPFHDQDDIPRFETRSATESMASLFQPNRFTGIDRVGDARRVTFGLESNLLDRDGRQWFGAAIARAWYLEDRNVQLVSTMEPETASASNYYAELEYQPTRNQSVRLDLSYEPHREETDFGSIHYQFRPGDYRVLNLAYRYRREVARLDGPLEQVDVSFATPIGGRWSIFGRAVYSLQTEHSQETLAGFEYETCCWVFRTFNRRFIFNRQGDFDQSIWFQLELKGLASVGRRIDEFLTDDIHGYGETDE